MRIIHLRKTKEPHVIEIKAVIGDSEFEQLASNLDHLCIFATKSIREPASATKAGARHQWVKYLLFPKAIRRQYRTDELNFENVTCGVVKYLEKVYVVYAIPRKDLIPLKDEGAG